MTLSELGLYAGALVILWITPGPVFVAITARALAGGFRSAWPLALGVTVGDLLWPLLAIFGLNVVVGQFAALMGVMRWVAAAIFLLMGWALIVNARKPVNPDRRLTRPGLWAGFSTGVVAVLGNPKAILFYMGVLPGFFDLRVVTGPDIAAIVALSVSVPLAGNLFVSALVGRARAVLATPQGMARINLTAGFLLLAVGVLIVAL